MCNTKTHSKTKNEFNSQTAYKRLAQRHQDLSDFIVKFASEVKPVTERSVRFDNLIVELERIVGGVPALKGEFPECCLIGTRNINGTIDWFCTGVLIHPKLVITAAHCISSGTSYVVALNASDENKLSSAEIINVRKAIVNPQYQNTNPNNDIAAFILQSKAATTPIKIATTAEIAASKKVTLVGFGNDDINSTKGFGLKRKVSVDIVSIRKKKDEDLNFDEAKYGYESDLEFVAGGNGFDTCNGDSGGPVYVSTSSTLKVAGLTSRATKDSVNPCGDGGVYTRVDMHKAFIDKVIKSI
jgi:secreted trypsin-like serine protease